VSTNIRKILDLGVTPPSDNFLREDLFQLESENNLILNANLKNKNLLQCIEF